MPKLLRVLLVIAAMPVCAAIVLTVFGEIMDWLALGSTLALPSDKKEPDLGPAFMLLIWGLPLASIASIWCGFAVWKWTGSRTDEGDA